MDRRILMNTMKEIGIRKELIERVTKVLIETKSTVKVGEEEGNSFWTAKDVRQRCPLNSTLFNLMLADIEEKWEE